MKGVSAIIATILMLIITIGLAGTAYVYISGMLSSKMEKTISVLDTDCNGTHATAVIANDGTDTIDSTDLDVYVNGASVTPGATPSIGPRETGVITDIPATTDQANTILIVSPSNSVRTSVWC